MSTLSKLLVEYTVVANVNDRLDITDAAAGAHTITLTAGRYRDMEALGVELQTQLDAATAAGTGQLWYVTFNLVEYGYVRIASTDNWTISWNTGSYGTDLRNDLGYDGTETVTVRVLDATNLHRGAFYPSEPVESDDRPVVTGTDLWTPDSYQQVGLTGLAATVGGENLRYYRSVQFLLAQDDLENYSTWLALVMKGESFAYYHDRDQSWDGPDSEYKEYKALVPEQGDRVGYYPDRVDPGNAVWHRATVRLIQRVAPTV